MHEVMEQVISGQADVAIEERQVDIDERASVAAMTETTCGCRKGIGSAPVLAPLMSVQASCSELTHSRPCSSQVSAPILAPPSSPLTIFYQCERLVLSLHA